MLGADGALVGSRLWASAESLAADGAKRQAVGASGDMSVRSPVFDIIRDIPWPAPYDFRALRNALHVKWEGRIEALKSDPSEARAEYQAGLKAGDYSRIHTPVGEGAGLIRAIDPAADIIRAMTQEALERRRLAG
jgi:nitronate monooxygenase